MSGDKRKAVQDTSQRLNNVGGVIINKEGYIVHSYVTIRKIAAVGQKVLESIHGIVVHQTGGPNLSSALAEANKGNAAAHFYTDKDGSIYQIASLDRACGHVGFLKPRCLIEHHCKPDEAKRIKKIYDQSTRSGSVLIHREESKKSIPDRYPKNEDSIGIELVGYYTPTKPAKGVIPVFDKVTDRQNIFLKWLVSIITAKWSVTPIEIFRHPEISRKTPTEAATAKW